MLFWWGVCEVVGVGEWEDMGCFFGVVECFWNFFRYDDVYGGDWEEVEIIFVVSKL